MGNKGGGSTPKFPDPGKTYEQGIKIALRYLPKQLAAEYAARGEYDPKYIEQALGLQHAYDPRLASEQLSALARRDPQWVALHGALGDKIREALARGYVDPRQEAAYAKYAALAGQGDVTRDRAYQALGKQVTGDTLRGATADPETLRQMTQAIMSQRPGLSYGEAQDMASAVYVGQRGQALKSQRQQAAQGFLTQQTPEAQREASLAQFYGMNSPEMQAYGLAGTYLQPSNSTTAQINAIQGVTPPSANRYVNPNAGYMGQQFGLQNYQNALAYNQLSGGGQNPWASALGGAASGAALGTQISPGYGTAIGAVAGGLYGAFSDKRLKTDIVKVGEQNGLDIVEFSYIGGHCRYRGVIAEQVQEKFPEAVGTRDGFLTVDYRKIGIPFQKRCKKCGTFKDINEFQSATDTIDEHIGKCKTCMAQYMKEWEQANSDRRRKRSSEWKMENPGYHRNWWLTKEYGISLIEFNKLVEDQKGLCAICEEPPGKKGLHADHCHANGSVRGLLCFRCNAALGMFRDNPRLLVNAIDYLTPRLLKKEAN